MLSAFLLCLSALPQQTEVAATDQAAIEKVVEQLYAAVSYAPGTMPQWESMADVFLPEAVLVMSYPNNAKPRIQSPKEFVQEYRDFLEQPGRNAEGFQEGPIYFETMVFGNIAHVDALFEAFLPPDAQVPVKRGIDSFQLLRVGKEWKILSLTSVQELGNRPLGNTLPPRTVVNLLEVEEETKVDAPAFEKISLPAERKKLAANEHRWLPVLLRNSMHLGLYSLPANSKDTQKPHEEDEVYYVLQGRGKMTAGEDTSTVMVGDLLYVDAGLEHRFHDIEEDLELLVFFAMR